MESTPDVFMEQIDNASSIFTSTDSLQKDLRIFLWYFSFIEIEINHLEVLTLGLKTIMNASNDFGNTLAGLRPELYWKVKKTTVSESVSQLMRHACYTMGLIANQLINPKSEQGK